jgi:histidinol-phosphatase (PHP family)
MLPRRVHSRPVLERANVDKQLIMLHGGRFALSDDSHGPHAVGLNYQKMRDYLLRIGVRELWTLERTRDQNAGGRSTAPVRVSGNWWDHDFWMRK